MVVECIGGLYRRKFRFLSITNVVTMTTILSIISIISIMMMISNVQAVSRRTTKSAMQMRRTTKSLLLMKSYLTPLNERIFYLGYRAKDDRMIYNVTIRKYTLDRDSAIVTLPIAYPIDDQKIGFSISYIEIIDRIYNSGKMIITEGGIGFRYINLLVKANRPVGMNYFLKVYTRESEDALDHLTTTTTVATIQTADTSSALMANAAVIKPKVTRKTQRKRVNKSTKAIRLMSTTMTDNCCGSNGTL